MRGAIGLGFIAFCVVAGVVVGNRLSNEALAVIVGVVFGVLAGVPMAVIIMLVMRRSQQAAAPPSQPQQPQPTVIVVGGQPQQLPSPPQSGPAWVDGRFRAVDEEEDGRRFSVLE